MGLGHFRCDVCGNYCYWTSHNGYQEFGHDVEKHQKAKKEEGKTI